MQAEVKVIHLLEPMEEGKGTVALFLNDEYGFTVFELYSKIRSFFTNNQL